MSLEERASFLYMLFNLRHYNGKKGAMKPIKRERLQFFAQIVLFEQSSK